MSGESWTTRKSQDGDPAAIAAVGLSHKLWLPHAADAPLYLLVHGRAGNSGLMWGFGAAVPMHANVLAPQAFLPDPHDGGHSWWLADGLSDEALATAVARLDHFLLAALSHYSLRPERIVALGFSQGAALLSVLLQDSPRRFAGVGLLAGFVIPRPPVAESPTTSVLIAHGTRDPVVSIERAREGAASLRSRGYKVEMHEDDVPHKVGKTGMRGLIAWSAAVGM